MTGNERIKQTEQKELFIKKLKDCNLTKQQLKTLKGQALNGDLEGAKKGLNKILKRGA